MRKAELAELLLSMATDREHAASIVGDAIEDGQADNPCRFWLFVVRTALGQVWRRLVADPSSMGPAAGRAVLVEFGLLMLWAGALVVVTLELALGVWRSLGHQNLPGWATQVPFILSNALASFTLGRWISRRYPGREGEGILTLAIVHVLMIVGAAIGSWLAVQAGGKVHLVVTVFVPVIICDGNIVHSLLFAMYYLTLYPMLLLAGAMTFRARSLRSAA
jgi:hypothetical protein